MTLKALHPQRKKSKNVKRSKTTKAQLKQPKTAKRKLDPEANAAKKAKIEVLNKQSQEIVKQTSCLKAEFTFYDKETKPAKRFTLDIFIDTKLVDVKKLASDIINLPADSILVIFKGQVLNKEELEFIRQWDGKGGISCVAKRKDPRKDAASNLFSHQEVEKDSSNHAPKHHHQEVNKPSPILEPLRSKSSPLPLVPTPSSPVVPKPASVTPSASPVASLAVPVTPTAASLTSAAASLTPAAAPITSATRCVMGSTKELSASHDPVGNVMGNLSRIEEKVDNLSSAVGNITEVLEKLANCRSSMKGLLKVLKTSNNLQATSKRKRNAVEEADNLVEEKGSTSRCLNSDIPVCRF